MSLDILTIGEALVEVMRTDIDQPLNRSGPFIGPYPSGAPFIFAVQSARLGLKTGAIGAVGKDAFGQCLIQQLEDDNIQTHGVHELEDHTTGVAFVAYNADGSRNFVFSLGAGGQLTKNMVKPAIFKGLRCFHVMGSTLSMNESALDVCKFALQLAIEHDALISFDPNLRPELLPPSQAKKVFAPFIQAADILIPTEEELLLLSDESTIEQAVNSLLMQKAERIIVITKGEQGCTVFTAEGSVDVAGFEVEEVDPTGAGDCFDAGFIAGILNGQSPEEAARLANACGAFAVSRKGPMAGAHALDTIEAFLKERG